jgi:RNA polymerase sigma factor (sigma-70 family)
MTVDAGPIRGDPPVAELVARARDGERVAWEALVERFSPLVWSICRRYRLAGADAEDAAQNVWLALAGHLDRLREPAALAGWLATATRRECGKLARAAWRVQAGGYVLEAGNLPGGQVPAAEEELIAAERRAALRLAFADLPPGCQRLLGVLLEDPPLSYGAVAARLGLPPGSIGPTRGRCLDKLRRHPAITALTDTSTGNTGTGNTGTGNTGTGNTGTGNTGTGNAGQDPRPAGATDPGPGHRSREHAGKR